MNIKYINRNMYQTILQDSVESKLVKILIGIRRCGKTSILNMHIEYLIKKGIDKNQIWHINFENIKNDKWKDGHTLQLELEKKIIKGKRFYLMIDEVQEMHDWARFINSFRVAFDIDIYITGSNSNLFAGEHLTYLSGRYMTINVFPLSFEEFKDFNKTSATNNDLYLEYLKTSFPEAVLETNERNKRSTLIDLRRSIVERDVILRGGIREVNIFNLVSKYIFSTVGNQISFKKIRDTLESYGTKTSVDTIHNYANLLISAHIIMHCPKYDVQGKKLLKTNGKYYSCDIGFANDISNNALGRGQMLENFVYLELIKKGWEVSSMNVNRDYEIDFVARRDNKTIYIQVCEGIYNDEIWERESRPFKYIKDNNERFVVSMDWWTHNSSLCKHINVFDFIEKIIK